MVLSCLVGKWRMVSGYVYSPIVSPREFRFSEMFEKVTDLKVAVDATDTGYIYNVGNSVGRPPRYKGQYLEDEYNVPRYQAAPAYREADWDASNMRYMQDGILLAILEETESFYKVNAYDYEGEYYVPKRYVTRRNAIEDLKQVIVVDIANQNQGTFEYRDACGTLFPIPMQQRERTLSIKSQPFLGVIRLLGNKISSVTEMTSPKLLQGMHHML